MVRMARLVFLVCLLFLCPNLASSEIHLESDVSPQSGGLYDEYTFTVTIKGASKSEFPLLSGGENFELKLVGPESSVHIANGQMTQQIRYVYHLTPKKIGALKTPLAELEIDGKKFIAPALSVQVSKASVPKLSSREDLILKQSLSKQTVYVGEQVVNRFDLYEGIPVIDANFNDLSFEGFWHEDMGSEENFQRYIQGRKYIVHRLQKALFPLRSGQLEIPPKVLDVKVQLRTKRKNWDPFGGFGGFDPFGGFFGGIKLQKRRVRSGAVRVEVKPVPKPPVGFNTHGLRSPLVGRMKLSLGYSTDDIKVGDSKTLTLVLRGTANLKPIKEFSLELPPGLKVYNEAPERETSVVGDFLESKVTFRYSLVPLQSGQVHIPPVQLGYFDPVSKTFQLARTRDISFLVVGKEVHSPDALQSPDTPSDRSVMPLAGQDQTAPLATYKEEGPLSILSRQVSLSLSLLILSALFLCVLGVILYFRLHRTHRERRRLRSAIDTAETLEELSLTFRSYLGALLLEDQQHPNLQQILKRVQEEFADENLGFALRGIFDEIEDLLYGESEIGVNELAHLKEKIRGVIRNLR